MCIIGREKEYSKKIFKINDFLSLLNYFFLVHSVYAPCNLISIITLMVLIILEGKERREGVEVSI